MQNPFQKVVSRMMENKSPEQVDSRNDSKRESIRSQISKMSNVQNDIMSVSSSGSDSSYSVESGNLIKEHSMRLGLYSINLATKVGQRLHTVHMLTLPMIPIVIILAQSIGDLWESSTKISEIEQLQEQVLHVTRLSKLIQSLQEERASVALNMFINRTSSLDTLDDLQQYVDVDINDYIDQLKIKEFSFRKIFNRTDKTLANIETWPVNNDTIFETRLGFQIQHSLFREKIRDGNKNILEVLDWYNNINQYLLNYVSLSISESKAGDFYRYVIGFKNLMRSIEYAGKSAVWGIRYLSRNQLERKNHHKFITYEMLRKEYLNQTWNFLPGLKSKYDNQTLNPKYETYQDQILQKGSSLKTVSEDLSEEGFLGEKTRATPVAYVTDYFINMITYTKATKEVVNTVAADIKILVEDSIDGLATTQVMPIILSIFISLFIPMILYLTFKATMSMLTFSGMYDQSISLYRQERKKTEKLLTDLLPKQVIRQMKKGTIPKPESFKSVTIFLCDIVSFTNLSVESTANQIVDMLNDLYKLFDERIDNYDVYKVETIGDAYMVASGIPLVNEHHASEIAAMSLDLNEKMLTFEVSHKPGYQLKMRMGIHSGGCVAGVVGTKIPHYSVFGETVEIAGLMESSGEATKIQISEPNKKLLEAAGGFYYSKRESGHNKLPPDVATYWLLGKVPTEGLLNQPMPMN